MKKLQILVLFFILFMAQTSFARTIEVDVHGMTCPFCVDSLERKFEKMESVFNIQVSLKLKKIRIETDENEPSLEKIKQTILDAGFTPTNLKLLSDETE